MPTPSYVPASFKPSFKQELARWLYSSLLLLLLPFSLLFIAIKAMTKSRSFANRFWERYGLLTPPAHEGGFLIHCVSVGEVVAAEMLIKHIRKHHPTQPITITTTTPTGYDRVKQLFKDEIRHYYLPYDLPICMAALFSAVKPEKVLITEVELWPNMIHLAWKNNIPVYIVNARMTDRSWRSYKKIQHLFTPMLHKITAICAQGQRDYDNYLQLGAAPEQVVLTNNVKFDQTLTANDIQQVNAWQQKFASKARSILVAGSTHEPEEQILLDSFVALRQHINNLLLIIVPRHPDRFDKVASLIQKSGLKYHRLSSQTAIKPDCQIVLADQMGVLKSLYGVANVAFVGGSIAKKGGHNPLEPALHAVPILMGKEIYNNPGICHALADVGALQFAADQHTLQSLTESLLLSPEESQKRGKAGQYVIQTNSGAIKKTLTKLGL